MPCAHGSGGQLGRHVGERSIEVIEHAEDRLEDLPARPVRIGRAFVGDAPSVVLEVGAFLPEQVEQLLGSRLIGGHRSGSGILALVVHQSPPCALDCWLPRRSGGPYGNGMYSTEGRRWAVCGYSCISSKTTSGMVVETGRPISRASSTVIG